MKQLFLYSSIYSFIAEEYVKQISELGEDEPFATRINCPGGSVFAGNSMMGAIAQHKGETLARVDGHAASMGFYMLPYFDKVESLDSSLFMVHRADGYAESEEDRKLLATINADLRKKLEAKIDVEQFEKETKVKFSDIFEAEKRIDVWLTAKQAKKIGLVDKIIRLDTKETKALANSIAAFSTIFDEEIENKTQGSEEKKAELTIIKKNKIMTKETLKAENSAIYEEILALGVAKEQTRVKAWLAYQEIDPVAVSKGISEGTDVDVAVMASMQVAAFKKTEVVATQTESVAPVATSTDNTEKTAEQIEAEALQSDIFARLNLKKEDK